MQTSKNQKKNLETNNDKNKHSPTKNPNLPKIPQKTKNNNKISNNKRTTNSKNKQYGERSQNRIPWARNRNFSEIFERNEFEQQIV